MRHLTSTGTFNYHLDFLLQNSVIVKGGIVCKLVEKGLEIARFVKDVDQIWNKLELTLRGERMSIFSFAEQFERALESGQTYQAVGRLLEAEKDLFSKVEGGDKLY